MEVYTPHVQRVVMASMEETGGDEIDDEADGGYAQQEPGLYHGRVGDPPDRVPHDIPGEHEQRRSVDERR